MKLIPPIRQSIFTIFFLTAFYSVNAEANGSAIYIAAPMHVHLVVTDPSGRKVGFNPETKTTYSEVPTASYVVEGIDAANEERQITISRNALPGAYRIQVFSKSGGSYYLDYRGYDSSGTTNDARYLTGSLKAGTSTVEVIDHSLTSTDRFKLKCNQGKCSK